MHNCYCVLQGYAPDPGRGDRVECPALLTAIGFVQVLFGYPNEEAYWKDGRGGLDHGFNEIEGSGWSRAIADYNSRSFGSTYFRGDAAIRHFFIGSKDGSCQVLARELTVEPLPGQGFRQVVAMIPRRIHEYLHKR